MNYANIKSGGKTRYCLTNWVDITERKQAEEAMEHAAKEWSTTFD